MLNFQVALREQPPLTEVFVAHLKSKLPERVYTEDRFTADEARFKATALRILLTNAMKGTVTPVLVLGDLNDGQHSNTVNILTEEPRYLVGESRGGVDTGLLEALAVGAHLDGAAPRRRRSRSR